MIASEAPQLDMAIVRHRKLASSATRGRGLKIIHADTDDLGNPLHGGQPVRTYEVNSRLAERHDITVLTSTYQGAQSRLNRGAVHYRRLGLRVPGLGLSPHLSFLSRLGPAIRSMPHDLIVEEFTPPLGFCLLPWWTSRPVVSIVQWFMFDDWERRYHLPFQRMMRVIPRRARYRRFIVQSARMADYFRELIPQARVSVIPCGVNEEMFQQQPFGDYALYLGRLEHQQKGTDLLLDVWERLCSGGERIPLRIAGSGPFLEAARERVHRAGLDDVIHFVGYVSSSLKRQLLRDCRFMVMPSRSETFGLSALEAMASSKPVIAFDIDHLGELLDSRWALKAPPFSVEAFADAVAGLWREPDRCLALGERACVQAQNYRWDAIARRQEAVYEQVMEEELTS